MNWQEREQQEQAAKQKWLAELKVGDAVAIPLRRYHYDTERYLVLPVARLTSTQVVVENGDRIGRYRRDDGLGIGKDSGCIVPATDAVRAANRRHDVQVRLRSAVDKVENHLRTGCKLLTAEQEETILVALESVLAQKKET